MDQLDRVSCGEGQRAGQQLVKGDPQRVQVAAGVDRAIHPAGLLRRHVGECAGDHLGRLGRLPLAREARREAEPGEPDLAVLAVDHDIRRLDVLVDETA
ncbi:MAG TPA: hypothetical protein VNO87_07885, partial [Methylomirabilota bacterium]|nr:hypothetical protein [Methylomirabilota bacterium]